MDASVAPPSGPTQQQEKEVENEEKEEEQVEKLQEVNKTTTSSTSVHDPISIQPKVVETNLGSTPDEDTTAVMMDQRFTKSLLPSPGAVAPDIQSIPEDIPKPKERTSSVPNVTKFAVSAWLHGQDNDSDSPASSPQDEIENEAMLLQGMTLDNPSKSSLQSAPSGDDSSLTDSEPRSPYSGVEIKTESRNTMTPNSRQTLTSTEQASATNLRYSKVTPPPMTDLEFWGALVQDHARTAQYLPTLLTRKIRNGIPAPLRGVVWQSMSGARDTVLEEQFDRLSGESSPYEGMIGKDLGRSFPGVEMFRDPDGQGQQMLGRVLRCFSLYDDEIGYCQGLAFLVGPLLMHMGDKQAFSVLVRLMESYEMRSCFLPDLSGLHMRIYQFRQLLKTLVPNLSVHLDAMEIEPAYVSQWFLSFFAVTCPLPMLFRIYDVIFAEGASVTIMRVALSLMQKNESKILACAEYEDVISLLLSRGLWDVYHYNADEFVNDFVSLSDQITVENLQVLGSEYREKQSDDLAASSQNVGSAATRFLGRLWAGPSPSPKTESRNSRTVDPISPSSVLRRSWSKQSMALTLNSIDDGASDSTLSLSTDATSVMRDSSNTEGTSILTHSLTSVQAAKADKNLHTQIEDLLMALNELQKENALLFTQLQKEREERDEDRSVVSTLLKRLQNTNTSIFVGGVSEVTSTESGVDNAKVELSSPNPTSSLQGEKKHDDLSFLIHTVESRFVTSQSQPISTLQSKAQLQEELHRTKEQLSSEVSKSNYYTHQLDVTKEQLELELAKSQEFSRQASEYDQEIKTLRDQIKDRQLRVQSAQSEKSKLELQLQEMRKERVASTQYSNAARADSQSGLNRMSSVSGLGNLRELRLGRMGPKNPISPNYRASIILPPMEPESLPITSAVPVTLDADKQSVENDVLVLELVQAKTAEANARQEAEKLRHKIECVRKLLNQDLKNTSSSEKPNIQHRVSPSLPASTGLGSYFSNARAEENITPTAPVMESDTKISPIPPRLSHHRATPSQSLSLGLGSYFTSSKVDEKPTASSVSTGPSKGLSTGTLDTSLYIFGSRSVLTRASDRDRGWLLSAQKPERFVVFIAHGLILILDQNSNLWLAR
ncbi:Bgt-4199 [Blumeria graminis f. sp. tritici]|uniref:GTPase-activating protein (GAP) n=2 Tax=Blumeria graminis f. sp. tritici TaxID=62690 RepID=A0A656KM86_BLUGR|nr:GTPase-activating protein (GAP) [Blumeria graminis f. sp. tritici 96224]VDB93985.1 Bgt-4199 [Blumeria graminis f. sp. tritici]